MERPYMWMEHSLRRTSDLGREVLERARRRDEDWWSGCNHSGQSPQTYPAAEVPEGEHPTSLEEAFSVMSRFMRLTTEHCERYHSCVPAPVMNRSEIQHFSRFHCRKPQMYMKPSPRSSVAPAPLQSPRKMRGPRDVYIEVAPGTYSISAGSPTYQSQTHLVNITPGQSVDLTFNV